jgi:hypothetical protein
VPSFLSTLRQSEETPSARPILLSVGGKVRLLNSYSEAAFDSLKEAGVITLIDVVVSLALLVLFRIYFFDSFGIVLLLEGAVIMLIGGALGFAGQPGVVVLSKLTNGFAIFSSRRREETEQASKKADPFSDREAMRLGDIRAAFFMLVGVYLFVESMALAFVVH